MSFDPSPDSEEPLFPDSRHVLEPDCERCPALAESRECISWGTGSLEASVLVVGEAPGYGNPDADRWQGGNWTGKAYTSRHSGRRIRRMLADLGYDDAYYTNAVKCFPAEEPPRASRATGEGSDLRATDLDEPTTNREPTPEEREACRRHLLTELETVDPDAVVATGKHATASLLAAEGRELDGFLETVLEPVACERLETWLVPVFHPSYQDVWIDRLGYDPESYLTAIGAAIAECREAPIDAAIDRERPLE